uniref:Uncharacterized protein n=1 Tax=Tanacetum cinerariifolium TaxID=118510 RepID=A0A6L2LQM2_TANCI|nr:hypothetical protein [Tanacetum cinerariifolium]
MDDPNITLEEYIILEEEKAQRQGRTFDWQTARYDKIEYYENKDDSFTNLEIEYLTMVFDDISDVAFSHEPTVDRYDEGIVHSYEQRLEMIWDRLVNRVHVLDFTRLIDGEMAEHWFKAYWSGSERVILDKGDLRDYWVEISSDRDFLGLAPSYVHIKDPVRRLCHRMIACSIFGQGQGAERITGVVLFYLQTMDCRTANVPYLLAQYLFHHAKGRKSGARLSGGHFIGHLAIQAHAQAPQPPPPAPQPRTMSLRIDRLEEEVREMQQIIVGLRGVVKSSITEQTIVSTWMISCMTHLMDASGQTYQAFDGTLVGSS